jgi:large subunit ribosomal protein L25
MLTYGVSSLDIECLPGELPPQVEVDLSPLEVMDQAIHVRDIAFKASITVITDPDQLIVKVSPARVERVEEKAVEKEVVAEAAAEQPEAAAKESAEAEPEAKS